MCDLYDLTTYFYYGKNDFYKNNDLNVKLNNDKKIQIDPANICANKSEKPIRGIWERIKNWASSNEQKKDPSKRNCLKNLAWASAGVASIIALGIFAIYFTRTTDQELGYYQRKDFYADNTQRRSQAPIPTILQSQIKSEKIGRNIHIITAYDAGIKDYADYVIPNQRAYAAKKNYSYIEYFGNLAHDEGTSRAPYWSKIVALNDQLEKTKEGDWLAWTDASVLFTNSKKNFDQVIEQYGKNKDIIVTTDPHVPINNAVFLIKNTPWTKSWIKKVWERSDLAKGGEGNCWSWGQPFCHYEQQAMTELWERNPEVKKQTARIPNKIMNSFYRYSHYDPYRDLHQNYDTDPKSSKWSSGDFICKVTGMDKDRRLLMIKHVAQNCIDKPCEFKNFG